MPTLVDFVYIATHGKYSEDGRLQAILELLKIPYLGSKVFGSALSMNKSLHNLFLQSHGIKIPKGFELSVEQVQLYDQSLISKLFQKYDLTFPVIIKPQNEGSSFGVSAAYNHQDLQSAVRKACFIGGRIGQPVLVEEKIIGMEFCCTVITDYMTGELLPLPLTEIVLRPGIDIFDYRHKYMPGVATKRTPPACDVESIKKIQDTCVAAMKALQLTNVGRFDGFLTADGDVVIIDTNPLPGMAPSSMFFRQGAQLGIGHGQLINHLIKTELKNYHMQRQSHQEILENKIKVAVLFGGASNEKEISLESGRNVCYKLSPEKYEVIPVFVDSYMQLHIISHTLLVSASTSEICTHLHEAEPLRWADLKNKADFAFLALHGGQGENGVVQGTLEMLGLPYNGPSVFTSSLCMDKYKTGQLLKAKGFDVPEAFLLSKQDFMQKNLNDLELFVQAVGFPCIVKPHDDGCSVMVASAKNHEELLKSLEDIFAQKDFALIEQRLVGMELTVGVVGNKNPRALAPSEAIAQGGILSIEEKFLPGAGENQTPARLPKEDILFVQRVIRDAFIAVGGQGYSRIDCFFQSAAQSPTGEKRVVILEINTLPGLTPATCLFHQAAEEGLRPMELLDEIIQLGFDAHRQDDVICVDQILQNQDQV